MGAEIELYNTNSIRRLHRFPPIQLLEPYYIMNAPYFGPRCHKVGERLIANFYRHPGTALYLKMVTGYDSYMHQAWRIKK